MTLPQTFFLLLGGVVFALWAFQLFRVLFMLRRRATARTGKNFPGPLDALKDWGGFLTAPEDTRARRMLALTMVAMFAWIAMATMVLPT